MVGAAGFGYPIRQAVHRPEIYARLAGVSLEDAATPEATASVLRAEALAHRVFLNQAEDAAGRLAAERLSARLGERIAAGSLQRGAYFRCGS